MPWTAPAVSSPAFSLPMPEFRMKAPAAIRIGRLATCARLPMWSTVPAGPEDGGGQGGGSVDVDHDGVGDHAAQAEGFHLGGEVAVDVVDDQGADPGGVVGGHPGGRPFETELVQEAAGRALDGVAADDGGNRHV